VKGSGIGKKINVPLQDGAFVTVPQNLQRVLVMAGVKNAGMVTMPEDRPLTVGEAIGMAGGTKDRAKLTQVGLMRQTGNGVAREVLDLGRVDKGRSALNIVLQHGDILYVPEGKPVTTSILDTVVRSLGPLSLLSSWRLSPAYRKPLAFLDVRKRK
jgi:protein involved in polysaccharide export with SLBB domain